MGFQITQGAVFYIVMMVIVVFIGIAIVTGFNPLAIKKLTDLSNTFEPGELSVTGDLSKSLTIDCAGNAYELILKDVGFASEKKPSSKTDTLDFVVFLDHSRLLFPGKPATIKCSARDDLSEFNCGGKSINFTLSGIGAPAGRQTFHFTVWESRQTIISAAEKGDMTLERMLETYPQFYISSFDTTVNTDIKCDEFACNAIENNTACENNNDRGCYWSGSGTTRCDLCPTFTNCREYNVDQCTQCPIAKANCKTNIFYGCEQA